MLLMPCLAARAASAEPGLEPAAYRNFPLWESGQIPGAAGDGPLDAPFLTVFTPRAGTANGGAVVIAPGGGNIMLMYGSEGFEAAEVFNDWGITAFVLTYRLAPRYDNDARTRDGERALRRVRAHAAQWKLNPARIGFMGFSAGGHLAASIATRFNANVYRTVDAADKESARPSFFVPASCRVSRRASRRASV